MFRSLWRSAVGAVATTVRSAAALPIAPTAFSIAFRVRESGEEEAWLSAARRRGSAPTATRRTTRSPGSASSSRAARVASRPTSATRWAHAFRGGRGTGLCAPSTGRVARRASSLPVLQLRSCSRHHRPPPTAHRTQTCAQNGWKAHKAECKSAQETKEDEDLSPEEINLRVRDVRGGE